MGPGCFHPRNNLTFAGRTGHFRLQWGRDVSIPEMESQLGEITLWNKLQWGRDVSIPEMRLLDYDTGFIVQLQWGRDVSIPEMRCSTTTTKA